MQKQLFILLLFFVSGLLSAQAQPKPQLLRGKRVAVYLTKKQFNYDDTYLLDLSQFILTHRGEDAVVDNVKLEALIALGELIPNQLEDSLGADSAYFLNEKPELAREFLEHYDMAMGSLTPLGKGFADTDLILVVSPLVLGHYTVSEVYVRSNRIINEPKRVRTGRLALHFYRPGDGRLVSEFNTCVDMKKENPPQKFDFHNKKSSTGAFLAHLFSKAFDQVEKGQKEGCEQENSN